ncbi:hypothetical protein CCP3SC15_610018 [Gammaproteobacteria bacterium]
MTDRVTPKIGGGNPKPSTRIRVTKDDALSWLEARKPKLPITKRSVRRAKVAIRKRKRRESIQKGRDVTSSNTVAPFQVVYGECRVGGTLVFLHNPAVTTGAKNRLHLHHVVVLACHEIDSVQKLYLDDNEVAFGGSPDPRWSLTTIPAPGSPALPAYGNKVFLATDCDGTPGQAVQADLNTMLPEYWTSNHKLSNRALAYLLLVWDGEVWAEGQPEVSFLVRGKPLYDPRTSSTAYSSNAALVIADYLTDQIYGLGYTWASIDVTDQPGGLHWAADVCDENVTLRAGGTEKRYTIDGYFDTDQSPDQIVENMQAAMAGFVTYSEGKFKFWPGVYRTPTVTLTEDDLRGEPRITTMVSRKDNFNSIRGDYVAADKGHVETDFPGITVSAWVAEDNGEKVWEDVSLPFTTSPARAQRIAMIMLQRIRRSQTFSAPFGLKALQVEPGDTVMLELSRYGYSAKVFEVHDFDLTVQDGEILVSLALQEIDSAAFSWDETQDEQLVREAATSTLPNPFSVTAPSNLACASGTSYLLLRQDGTIFSQIYVSWTAPDDPYVTNGGQFEIQYKKSADSGYIVGGYADGTATNFYLLNVQDGVAYDVRVRSISALGVKSSFVTVAGHIVVGKTAPPSDVTGFAGTAQPYGVLLLWDAISDVDLREYEIRVGASWVAGVVLTKVTATTYRWNIQTAGSYSLYIKAKDTSGNYSTNAVGTTVSIVAPSAPVSAGGEVVGSNVVLTWEDSGAGDFAIKHYRIRYGTSFAAGTEVATARAGRFETKIDWSGVRQWWIAAEDVAGNIGTPVEVDVTIDAPGQATGITSQVVDNNVLLKWSAPATGSLTVDYYNVYKGDTFAGAVLLGAHKGTFATYIETVADTYTYWLVAIDSAGNAGEEAGVSAKVLAPPDYELQADDWLDMTALDTISNGHLDGTSVLLPVDMDVTWNSYWTANGWSDDDDAIAAGYDYYFQPTVASGYIEHTIDYGGTVTAAMINLGWVEQAVAGSLSATPTISYSSDGVNWTNNAGVQVVYAISFRYVKIKLAIGNGDGTSATFVSSIHVWLDVKIIRESGVGTANDTDVGGTSVSLTKTFTDVITVIVTPKGTTCAIPVVDFADVPNPTHFHVYLFDAAGNRVDGDFTWEVTGT